MTVGAALTPINYHSENLRCVSPSFPWLPHFRPFSRALRVGSWHVTLLTPLLHTSISNTVVFIPKPYVNTSVLLSSKQQSYRLYNHLCDCEPKPWNQPLASKPRIALGPLGLGFRAYALGFSMNPPAPKLEIRKPRTGNPNSIPTTGWGTRVGSLCSQARCNLRLGFWRFGAAGRHENFRACLRV